VIDRVSHLKPWRIRLPKPGTAGVLELPAGTLERSGTAVGHRIEFEAAPVVTRGRFEGSAHAVGEPPARQTKEFRS
jgi:hypothetical protein